MGLDLSNWPLSNQVADEPSLALTREVIEMSRKLPEVTEREQNLQVHWVLVVVACGLLFGPSIWVAWPW